MCLVGEEGKEEDAGHPGSSHSQATGQQFDWTQSKILKDTERRPSDAEHATDTRAVNVPFICQTYLVGVWVDVSLSCCCNFKLTSLFLRHFTTVAMPIMAFQSMFAVGFGCVRLPAEWLEEAVNGILAIFVLRAPASHVRRAGWMDPT